jgi:hypothetical protein
VGNYNLSPIERQMTLLQTDPDRVRFLPGAVMDHHAKLFASHTGTNQVTPESYQGALAQLKRRYPTLARAAENGFIGSDDFWLLGVLIPNVAGEVEREHNVTPQVTQFSTRVQPVRRYGGDHVRYDASGNEYGQY